MPRCRSLYSRYFSTISVRSLCALAVFWYFEESPITSGDARALVNSSYLASIWFKRSNIVFCFYCSLSPQKGSHPPKELMLRSSAAIHVGPQTNYQLTKLPNYQLARLGKNARPFKECGECSEPG